MKIVNRFLIFGCIIVIFSSACGSIKKSLPDKRENYKSAKELPLLEVPPDLSGSVIDDPSLQTPDTSGIASYTEALENDLVPSESEFSDPPQPASVSSDDSGSFLEIYEPFPQAWRKVGKALSNLEIEIADRNRSIGMYYILYDDSDATQADEPGFWAGLAFWRDVKVEERERQFRVKLERSVQSTKVFLLDRAGKKQSQGVGLRFLKMMEEKLNSKKS